MPQHNEELAAWIDISLAPGLGPAQFRKLLSAFGLPQNILRANREQLARVVTPPIASAILVRDREKSVEDALSWSEQAGHSLITLADAAYPKQLYEIPDPPPLLYVRGRVELLSAPALAVVGSRNATAQGRANAEQFARALSDAGLTIVSGLALGIDTAAHKGGLAGHGSTIAVMGTGMDTLYPRTNAALGEAIANGGVLVTEFPLSMPPLSANFPRRNRLIAGLSRGVLVVEAALASGSQITARLAAEQGREVFAIPGSIHSPQSRGCHALIKQGAKLVESARDVLEEMGMTTTTAPDKPAVANPNLSGTISPLIQHMGYEPCDIGTLAARAGLTPEAVSAMLLQLELEGRISSLPGGFYQRLI